MRSLTFNHREPIGSSTYPMPGSTLDLAETHRRLSSVQIPNNTATIYIHIPFCDQICSFCGFNKFVSSEATKASYVNALIAEMEVMSRKAWSQSLNVEAVYIGGGTPNALTAPQLLSILKVVNERFPLSGSCQISCEGTPMNFTDERVAALKEGKVNRISTGIQTFDRSIREEHLHMREGKDELLNYISGIAKHFNSFNLDLIFNLPRQTDAIWNDDLETALTTDATHLTIYPLVLLEKTIFYSDFIKNDKYPIPDQDQEIRIFEKTVARLDETSFGAGRYTIRDWAKPGYSCRYIELNSKCNHILAFGAGAHGFVCNYTYRNESSIAKYIEMIQTDGLLPIVGQTFCSENDLFERFFVMGLRLRSFDLNKFREQFEAEIPERFQDTLLLLQENEYITINKSTVTFTEKGHVWANNIRSCFETSRPTTVGYSNTQGVGQSGKDHYSSISRVKATDAEAS